MTPIETGAPESGPTIASLLTPEAVRTRAAQILAVGTAGHLAHFTIDLKKLPATAAFVADTIRQNYPSLDVPPHSRWRHLSVGGIPWELRLGDGLALDPTERARQRIELAVTSVLLDAGAGPHWRWKDALTGATFTRSEGLALATLEAFRHGVFSSDPDRPCMADAAGLAAVSTERLASVFQVQDGNPLVGLEGRAALLHRLGTACVRLGSELGRPARLGLLFDRLVGERPPVEVAAPAMLALLLDALGTIWPSRLTINGVNLGDTWRHPAIDVAGPTRGLMPFHKLSQWLAYSLIEPIEEAGIIVSGQDRLTGLAEYRNGGLFIDTGVLVPRDARLLEVTLTPDQEPVVEWRALTVALLDSVAPLVRSELGLTPAQMPLASILEGGTWAAGRRIARQRRSNGGPPLLIDSDGTVF